MFPVAAREAVAAPRHRSNVPRRRGGVRGASAECAATREATPPRSAKMRHAMRWLVGLALLGSACALPPTTVTTHSPSPPTAPSPSTLMRTDLLPSFPPNVTYAGWVVVERVNGDLITVTTTMGSPPVLQDRVLTLRGRPDGLAPGLCVLVEFAAQVEADRTHRLIGVDLAKRPTNEASCPRSR